MSHYARQWAKRQNVGDSTTKTVLKVYADWASEDYSTWVTNEELLLDTELNIQTIRKARVKLIELGYLIETKKRIGETRSIVVYQMVAPPGSTIVQAIDQRTHETISLSPPSREEYEAKPLQKRSPSKIGASSAKTGKGGEKPSPSKNQAPPDSTLSPSKSHVKGGEIPPQAPPNLEPNKADIALESRSSSNARDADAVDNPAAAAADDEQTAGSTPLDIEARLTELLVGLESERGKRLVIDHTRDRVHILTWVGRELTEVELRIAHSRAAGARQRDTDERPVYVGFIAPFVDEVLAERDANARAASAEPAPAAQWWLSDSGIGGQGKRLHVNRFPNEVTPDYLVRVAKQSGRGPWIDHVLQEAQRGNAERYQRIVQFFGDELLPVDFYPS